MERESQRIKRQLEDVKEYVAKIGAPQPHFRDQDKGGQLHSLRVETQICHQASVGAKNYWESKYFDTALSEVVKARFTELAKEALALLERKHKDALIAEKEVLLAALAEIEAAECERAATTL